MKLKDNVIIIAGASSGIGEATAIKLAANGAKLSCQQEGKRSYKR